MTAEPDTWNCMDCGWSGRVAPRNPNTGRRTCPVCLNDELWDYDALLHRDQEKLRAWITAQGIRP